MMKLETYFLAYLKCFYLFLKRIHILSSCLDRFVDAFEGEIRAAVENAVTSKIKEGIIKLDSLLQNLPKEIGVDGNVAMNFTVMQAPDVGPKSISIGVEGLFVTMTPDFRVHRLSNLQPGISCSGSSKMLEIALSDTVLNSAAEVYTNVILSWFLPFTLCIFLFSFGY
ncbi:hypothetical protein SUGI_0992830 [Cryptomeria japonica]|nr:hypothetical protein SUGI_0992830 [Cryptomeria japonica]